MPATDKIAARIHRLGPGHAFTAKDFLDLGSRGLIDVTLSKLVAAGVVRRVARGLYDSPRTSALLGGPLSPDMDQVARALARRYRWRIIPEGAQAANALGLTTQVPARIVYLSDGPTRKVSVGQQAIYFKHARPKEMRTEGPMSSLVIQALRHLGRQAVGREVIDHLRGRLSKSEKQRLLRDARYSTDWIYDAARRIAEEGAG
ncbi:MAG TPA: DUF6088 family protein [Gemmataceae bacterium]|nr:DUF6088 family protein [Gemmataceae bacterium]